MKTHPGAGITVRKVRPMYVIAYGSYLSQQTFTDWREACGFMAYLLKSNTPITAVYKVQP